MRKRDALRLKPSWTIIFNRSTTVAAGGPFFSVEVLQVKENGRIHVEHKNGEREWIPHTWVYTRWVECEPSWKKPKKVAPPLPAAPVDKGPASPPAPSEAAP